MKVGAYVPNSVTLHTCCILTSAYCTATINSHIAKCGVTGEGLYFKVASDMQSLVGLFFKQPNQGPLQGVGLLEDAKHLSSEKSDSSKLGT